MQERGPIRLVSKGLPQLFDLPPQVKELVEGTKLLPLADIGFKTTSKGLINGFVERWHSDTSSFHLPIGEMSITLDDVSALTHLPIEGNFYDFPDLTKYQGEAMLVEMLGARQEEAAEMMAKNGVYVSLVFLRDTLYPRAVAEGNWAFAARAFIMFMLGWGPFVDKSGNRIKLGWLGALAHLQTAGEYSWGAMALAHLYDQLRDAEKAQTRQLAGWLALLQAWIFEHFQGPPYGKKVINPDYDETMPRARRWMLEDGSQAVDMKVIRTALDKLHPDEVCWQPYSDHRDSWPFNLISRFSGHIRSGGSIIAHRPERVLRQFGSVQGIPEDPRAPNKEVVTKEICDERWLNFDAHIVDLGQVIERGAPDTVPGYYSWFGKVSHPFMDPAHFIQLDDEPDARRVMPDIVKLVDEMEQAMKAGKVPARTHQWRVLEGLKKLVRPFKKMKRHGCLGRSSTE